MNYADLCVAGGGVPGKNIQKPALSKHRHKRSMASSNICADQLRDSEISTTTSPGAYSRREDSGPNDTPKCEEPNCQWEGRSYSLNL